MRRLILWTIPLVLALTTIGFLVAVFVFGYQAALTPGPNNEQADASFLSFMGALLAFGLTVGACFLATVAEDEIS